MARISIMNNSLKQGYNFLEKPWVWAGKKAPRTPSDKWRHRDGFAAAHPGTPLTQFAHINTVFNCDRIFTILTPYW